MQDSKTKDLQILTEAQTLGKMAHKHNAESTTQTFVHLFQSFFSSNSNTCYNYSCAMNMFFNLILLIAGITVIIQF